ncbi:uL15 family ribosomal protein [Candidatus Micrarchaeota archaeon]|nr:uL15 family ribosomal protein [Candidatus Micrarchaeota archaeon]
MARRNVSRRFKHRGNRTHGGGNTKNRRGKGNRGGVGRAGYHKHNWLRTIKEEGTNKKDKGLSGFHNPTRKIYATLSLQELDRVLSEGKIPKNDQGLFQVSLPKTKILSGGTLSHKAAVKAYAFSAKAKEKIEKAGGTTATD